MGEQDSKEKFNLNLQRQFEIVDQNGYEVPWSKEIN